MDNTKKTVLIVIAVILSSILLLTATVFGLVVALKGSLDTEAIAYGKDRMDALTKDGVTVEYRIYSDDEIAEVPEREKVVLTYMPVEEKTPFVIICPGGAYVTCSESDGVPVAAAFNELGRTAFVLKYRTGPALSPKSVYEDLAKAVDFVLENSEELNVDTANYALCGFSAGGQMVSTFGGNSVLGYKSYGLPKPGTLICGYAVFAWNSDIVAKNLLGPEFSQEERSSLNTLHGIDEKYPPMFFWQGKNDMLINYEEQSRPVEEKLKFLEIPYEFRLYDNAQHGCGLGLETDAENWTDKAVEFWAAQGK